MSNFFQTERWWEMQEACGYQVVSGKGNGWHYFGRVTRDRVGASLYLPYGPVAENISALREALEDAKKQAAKLGAYRLLVEPALPITAEDMAVLPKVRRIWKGYQPSRTQVIDLTQSEEEIIGAMNRTRRKNFRGAEKRGYRAERSKDKAHFEVCTEWLRAAGETKNFSVKDETYFAELYKLVEEGTAKVFVGWVNDELAISGLVVDDEDTRYYLYVGKNPQMDSVGISAPLIFELLFDAKRAGLKTFDFYGISARDDVEDEWSGFTRFKQSFGGESISYAGTWEIPVSGLKTTVRRLLDKRGS